MRANEMKKNKFNLQSFKKSFWNCLHVQWPTKQCTARHTDWSRWSTEVTGILTSHWWKTRMEIVLQFVDLVDVLIYFKQTEYWFPIFFAERASTFKRQITRWYLPIWRVITRHFFIALNLITWSRGTDRVFNAVRWYTLLQCSFLSQNLLGLS